MSALGQKQTCAVQLAMSAKGQLADIGHLPAFSLCSASHNLCSIPNMVDQAPNTTVTRTVVYDTVTMYIPQREF